MSWVNSVQRQFLANGPIFFSLALTFGRWVYIGLQLSFEDKVARIRMKPVWATHKSPAGDLVRELTEETANMPAGEAIKPAVRAIDRSPLRYSSLGDRFAVTARLSNK